jgi:hypothetical protein
MERFRELALLDEGVDGRDGGLEAGGDVLLEVGGQVGDLGGDGAVDGAGDVLGEGDEGLEGGLEDAEDVLELGGNGCLQLGGGGGEDVVDVLDHVGDSRDGVLEDQGHRLQRVLSQGDDDVDDIGRHEILDLFDLGRDLLDGALDLRDQLSQDNVEQELSCEKWWLLACAGSRGE